MKFNVSLPFDRTEDPDEFLTLEAVGEIGAALERVGFHSCSVTDHPCPTARWLDAGGHHAQDPFVMLALVASVTHAVRLLTGILVLPYRNPFITARSVATLDLYSRGRVTLGLGAGYLKAEYRALGVDFDRRNEIMDEYLLAVKVALGGEEFVFEGTGYQAFGNRILPGPVQKPHPPLWVGGNSRRAIRRAVELADGWYPFFTAGGIASASTRTAEMSGEADLAQGVAYLREHCERIGRTDLPTIFVGSITTPGESWTPAILIDRIGRYRDLGVVGAGIHIAGATRAEWCDNADRFGADVLARIGA
jgi:probable F420-dependent oxidoreductase